MKYIIALIFSSLMLISNAQVNWIKYDDNPVISKGGSIYEMIALGQPTVLFENDTFKMWYAAVGADMKARISYAWSMDGVFWIKYNNAIPVLDVGGTGKFDSGWLDAPEVVRGPDGYKMYYYGDVKQQSPEVSSAYGLATSKDGINWTKYASNPVFTKGDSAGWDGKWVESPAVIYDSAIKKYFMYYNGVAWNWLIHIGLATSDDGINWTRFAGNPIMTLGPSKSFDDMWMAVPAVIKTKNVFEMWYVGFSSISAFDTLRIGYATSPDGYTWTKYENNLVYSRFHPPFVPANDTDGPWAPDVVFNPKTNEYLMWYEGSSGIQFAKSSKTISIESESDPSVFRIYPNPVNANHDITITSSNKSINSVFLYDVFGRLVFSSNSINSRTFMFKPILKISGLYYMLINSGNEIKSASLYITKSNENR